MSGAVARLAELGLVLPPVPAPVAAYVSAVRAGGLLMTSGQLPFQAGTLPATGLVGDGEGCVPPSRAAELARTAALNGLAALASVVADGAGEDGGVDGVDPAAALEGLRVVRAVVYVASAPGFTGQPAVADGASRLLLDVLGKAGRHARSAVGVAALPLGSPVEVELVAELIG